MDRIDIIDALQREGWTAREAEADLTAIEEEGVVDGRVEAFDACIELALSELHEGHVVVQMLRKAKTLKPCAACGELGSCAEQCPSAGMERESIR